MVRNNFAAQSLQLKFNTFCLRGMELLQAKAEEAASLPTAILRYPLGGDATPTFVRQDAVFSLAVNPDFVFDMLQLAREPIRNEPVGRSAARSRCHAGMTRHDRILIA